VEKEACSIRRYDGAIEKKDEKWQGKKDRAKKKHGPATTDMKNLFISQWVPLIFFRLPRSHNNAVRGPFLNVGSVV